MEIFVRIHGDAKFCVRVYRETTAMHDWGMLGCFIWYCNETTEPCDWWVPQFIHMTWMSCDLESWRSIFSTQWQVKWQQQNSSGHSSSNTRNWTPEDLAVDDFNDFLLCRFKYQKYTSLYLIIVQVWLISSRWKLKMRVLGFFGFHYNTNKFTAFHTVPADLDRVLKE